MNGKFEESLPRFNLKYAYNIYEEILPNGRIKATIELESENLETDQIIHSWVWEVKYMAEKKGIAGWLQNIRESVGLVTGGRN